MAGRRGWNENLNAQSFVKFLNWTYSWTCKNKKGFRSPNIQSTNKQITTTSTRLKANPIATKNLVELQANDKRILLLYSLPMCARHAFKLRIPVCLLETIWNHVIFCNIYSGAYLYHITVNAFQHPFHQSFYFLHENCCATFS